MPIVQEVDRFFRRLKRFDGRYFRHKFYDSSLRAGIEANADFAGLQRRFPGLREEYEQRKADLDGRLLPNYKEYVAGVSDEIMAASLELSRFLLFLCESRRPGRILDLGSGFTSFVFRAYARAASPRPAVWSVDDSVEWLEKTRAYLVSKGLDTDHLVSWDRFESQQTEPFDFILYDLGGFEFRKNTFEKVLDRMAKDGVLVVDDMHAAEYGLHVKAKVAERGMSKYSVRRYTHDRFNRYASLVLSDR
jgi:predicted O-methyltransferase YrrM